MRFVKVNEGAAAEPVAPSNAAEYPIRQIIDAKQHVVVLCAMIANLQKQIDDIQAHLAQYDPTVIRQIQVAGYPPANLKS